MGEGVLMEYRGAYFNEYGGIEAEVDHPEYGWIPTTLVEDDASTKELFHKVKKDEGLVFMPPEVDPALSQWRKDTVITKFQLLQTLDGFGILQDVEDVVPSMSSKSRLAWDTAYSFRRSGNFTKEMTELALLDEAFVDELFTHAIEIDT